LAQAFTGRDLSPIVARVLTGPRHDAMETTGLAEIADPLG